MIDRNWLNTDNEEEFILTAKEHREEGLKIGADKDIISKLDHLIKIARYIKLAKEELSSKKSELTDVLLNEAKRDITKDNV